MAENTEIASKNVDPKEPTNIFSFLSKLKLQLPFLKQEPKEGVVVVGDEEGNRSESRKPDVVTFPKAQLVVPPPVAVENEETGKTSNPIIIWQVYALGGFLVLRWIWARWNERKGQKEDSDDNDDEHPAE
ncbi:hypothetical protein UlMin_026100 [Ulmus minor]